MQCKCFTNEWINKYSSIERFSTDEKIFSHLFHFHPSGLVEQFFLLLLRHVSIKSETYKFNNCKLSTIFIYFAVCFTCAMISNEIPCKSADDDIKNSTPTTCCQTEKNLLMWLLIAVCVESVIWATFRAKCSKLFDGRISKELNEDLKENFSLIDFLADCGMLSEFWMSLLTYDMNF